MNHMQEHVWTNRDNDTHMHIIDDLHYTREDLRPTKELTNWEQDLIRLQFNEYDNTPEE